MKGISILLAGAMLLAGTPAFASSNGAASGAALETVAATLAPNDFRWAETPDEDAIAQPISIVVSIADQRAYVYRGEALVAVSTVSTGKEGKDTPIGTYTILQKNEKHKSNLYNAAPMPFMQRLTWDGIAIHAGRNPGFPDSHGCIRVPTAFAKKLFAATSLGTVVTVTDQSIDGSYQRPEDLVPPEVMQQAAVETAKANAQQLASLRN